MTNFTYTADIQKWVEERCRQIMAQREKIIESFIAETGLRPSECVMIERRRHDGGWEWAIEKKPDDWPSDKDVGFSELQNPERFDTDDYDLRRP